MKVSYGVMLVPTVIAALSLSGRLQQGSWAEYEDLMD
jgi:hypothetical protein